MKESMEKNEKNILIKNPEELDRIKEAIRQGGPEKMHVIADFDRTLTYAFVNGEKRPSLISVLRDENRLAPGYADRAKALFDKYGDAENDKNRSLKERKQLMEEWWRTHFYLLIKSGLNIKDLEEVVDSQKVKFREGFTEFLENLKSNNIPLVIMSSGGLGGDSIRMFLEKRGLMKDNIYIISNTYEWDKDGNAIGVKEPIIHALNKDETAIQDFSVFKTIKNRKNVILLGDGLGDIGMVEGFDHDNLIKIGFLNDKVEENLGEYQEEFDVVITEDSDMHFVNNLIESLTSNN